MLDKIKQLSKETALYGISTVLGRFLNFLLVPLYTNIFTTDAFGVYSTVYTYIAFFQIVFIYGMDMAYLKYGTGEKGDSLKKIFSTGLNSVFYTSLLLSAALLLFAYPIADFITLRGEYSYLIFSVIGILFFDAITNIPYVHLRLQRRPLRFALIRTINIIVNLTLNIILILGFNFGIEAIFYSNLAASIVNLILLLPVIKENYSFCFKKDILSTMLKFGLPFLPAALTSMIVRVIDRPLIEKMLSIEEAGIYGANYRLGIFMMLFVGMFQYAWQPFFLDNSKDADAKKMFGRILTLFLIVASGIWLILSIFINDIIQFEILPGRYLIGPDYWEGTVIVPIVLLGYLFNGMYVNFTAGIFIEAKTKYMLIVTIIGAVTNILLNIVLLPQIGILGGAVAMLVSYLAMTITIFLISQKFYRIPYEYLKIFGILIAILITWGLKYYNESYLGYGASYKIGLIVLFTSLLFLFRVVNLREMKSLINLVLKRK